MEQLSLFDSEELPDIGTVTEEQAAEIVGEQIGVKFSFNKFYEHWIAKMGKLELNLNYDSYAIGGKLFLGVGYVHKEPEDYSGGGSPCDSIEEAVKYFKDKIRRYNA